jgi:2-C-methyl-D-erythritol 4-phosphate cytidylyltransferase
MTTTFIVTAGGIGKRMGGNVPKQFIEINGKPILIHTLLKLHAFNSQAQFILTLPSEWVEFWRDLCEKHDFTLNVELVEGGRERFHSIKNALKYATGEIIAIHDGVRPLVSHQTLRNLIEGVSKYEAVIPIAGIKESVRLIKENASEPINRDTLKIVQTPQVFRKELILKAYENEFSDTFTDDASVVEKLGVSIQLIQGNDENIKITTPLDLKLAEYFLQINSDYFHKD